MVAVVVPSPAMSEVLEATSRTIWAPMFSSGSLRSISLATVTPSLVMVGPPNFFSSTTFRPFGPRVTFTASASWFTPRRIACRELSAYTICFAIELARFLCSNRLLIENAEYVVLAHDHVLCSIQPDFAAGVLTEENVVAHLNIQRDQLAIFQAFALPDGHHFTLLRLFFRRIGNVQATVHHVPFVLNALDYNAVI